MQLWRFCGSGLGLLRYSAPPCGSRPGSTWGARRHRCGRKGRGGRGGAMTGDIDIEAEQTVVRRAPS